MGDEAPRPDDRKLGEVARTDQSFSLLDEGTSEEEMFQELGSVLANTPMSGLRELLAQDQSGKKIEEFIEQNYAGDPVYAMMLSEEVFQWLQQRQFKSVSSSSKPAVCNACHLLPIESKHVPSSAKPSSSATTTAPTKSTAPSSTQMKLDINVSRTYLWNAIDNKIRTHLDWIYHYQSDRLNVFLQNLAGILIKLLLKVDAASETEEVLIYKGTFSSWVLTLRNYLEAILYTYFYEYGKLMEFEYQHNQKFKVIRALVGVGFKEGQNDGKVQNLQVTCGICAKKGGLSNLRHDAECEMAQKLKRGERLILLKKGRNWFVVNKKNLVKTQSFFPFLKDQTLSDKAVRAFVLYCDEALRSYDTDLDTALGLTEDLLHLAEFLKCQKKKPVENKQWWSDMKPKPGAAAHHLRVSGLSFNVSDGVKVNDLSTSHKTSESCLTTIGEYKAIGEDIPKVQLRLAYLQQALIEAKEELNVLQHFQGPWNGPYGAEHTGKCTYECEMYKLAFEHGSEFLKDSKALTISSISVVLTQLEQTVLLFTALNARTPAPKKEFIQQQSVELISKSEFECVDKEGKLETISSPVPTPSDYVDLKWLKWAEETTRQNAEDMKEKKIWLTLPTQAENEEAWKKALELANNWNSEVKRLKDNVKVNKDWRTEEEVSFLRYFFTGSHDWRPPEEFSFVQSFFGEAEPSTTDGQRKALYLELLFLSDRLHVDHLFYGSKKRGFTLLSKYLQRVLDLGVILGCLQRF